MSEFSPTHWAIFLGMLGLLFLMARGLFRMIVPAKLPPVACTTCGTTGPPKRHTRGSILIEIVLWLCFIIPGVIYSLWRITTRQAVCKSCGSQSVVPLNTPAGQRVARGDTAR